ncbi:MAG: hypothetical protein NVSMB47_05370 [Polyangiales bacterium]
MTGGFARALATVLALAIVPVVGSLGAAPAKKTSPAKKGAKKAAPKASSTTVASTAPSAVTKTVPTTEPKTPVPRDTSAPAAVASSATHATLVNGPDSEPVATTTEPPAAETSPAPPLIVVGVLGELATRRFTYDGTTSGGLRPYNLPNVAAVGVDLELRPFHARNDLISGLALAGDLHQSIGLRSTVVGSTTIATASWTRFDGLLRWWLPLDGARAWWLAPSLGYGQDRFAFSPSTPDLPSVAYRYARGGVDVLARLSSRAAIFLNASYLLVSSGGEVSEHFRRATTWGLEVGGGLAVDLSAAIELRVAVDWRRFTAKFGGAQPGDPYVAAGAVDELVRTLFGVRLRY